MFIGTSWRDLGELAPSVQLLDLPVPQMVDQPVDILKIIAMLLPAVDEQVIDVPKIIQDSTPAALEASGASAAGGTVGGSADRPDSHAHCFADGAPDRRHSSSWSCSRFLPKTEFRYFLFPSPLSGWSSATPTAGPTSGTVALKRLFGRLRVAFGLSGLE